VNPHGKYDINFGDLANGKNPRMRVMLATSEVYAEKEETHG